MTHIAGRGAKLRGLATFHAWSSHSRVIARCSPAHVPTRHSSRPSTGTAGDDGVCAAAFCFFSSPKNETPADATSAGTEASSSRAHP